MLLKCSFITQFFPHLSCLPFEYFWCYIPCLRKTPFKLNMCRERLRKKYCEHDNVLKPSGNWGGTECIEYWMHFCWSLLGSLNNVRQAILGLKKYLLPSICFNLASEKEAFRICWNLKCLLMINLSMTFSWNME